MKVAICRNSNKKEHSTSWTSPWIDYCSKNNIEYEILDPYRYDIIDKVREFDILLWHFSGYSYADMLIARNILFSAKRMGLKVFPDFNDCWHFDDKIAETYFLQSVNAPIPSSYMLYSEESLRIFIESYKEYPVVAKLKNGSGAHNVKLISSSTELSNYGKIMFTKGFNSSPSLLYKTSSNIKSSKSIKTFLQRLKRAPEFLRTLRKSQDFPREKGYVFLQEYIENPGYDLKVVVIGDKLSFIGRKTRKNDFRASGGGDIFYEKDYIPANILESAFSVSEQLGFQCMGYDYVVNDKTGEGVIVEISYGFSHQALLGAEGYYDRKGTWHNEPLNAPEEVLKNLIACP